MDKLNTAKTICIAVILFCVVGANTTSLFASNNALGNDFDTQYEIGIGRHHVPNDDPVVAGAGDIARCSMPQAVYTAALLGNIDGDVITFGDNTQLNGTAQEFADCYNPTWGVYKYKTHPSPGNHDYNTANAQPYYDYFGVPEYYSYDTGFWHLISLNSEIDISSNSVQVQWLRADLEAHRNICILAYWHRPRFSSSTVHPNDPSLDALWDVLYEYNVDVVLNGHNHLYERFAPQNPQAVADPQGIREFTVGTGGGGTLYAYGNPIANSEVINNQTYGVIKLTLHQYSYDWEFIPIAGQTFTDSGSSVCSSPTFVPDCHFMFPFCLNTFIPLIGKK
jgi:hypothetical protein